MATSIVSMLVMRMFVNRYHKINVNTQSWRIDRHRSVFFASDTRRSNGISQHHAYMHALMYDQTANDLLLAGIRCDIKALKFKCEVFLADQVREVCSSQGTRYRSLCDSTQITVATVFDFLEFAQLIKGDILLSHCLVSPP